MPLTKFDHSAALLVVDLQKGVVSMPTAHPVGEVTARAAQLAHSFRERGLPVVLVNVTATAPGRTDVGRPNLSSLPADWSELVPELKQHPNDHPMSKQRVGAFIGTSVKEC